MNENLNVDHRAAGPGESAIWRAWAWTVGRVGHIPVSETSVARRGFAVESPDVVLRLEAIGGHFVWGYNLAVGSSDLQDLGVALAASHPDDAGFAYEGAAMGVAIADFLTPGRRMFDAYVATLATGHEYMAWVGLGWALARLPVAPQRALARYRNLHCWLALDGYGFHEGYFNWRRGIVGQRRARGLSPDAHRVFDQGLGRSLWFVRGAQPMQVALAIDAFAPERQQDLWAGVGLAAAYAGASKREALAELLRRSGSYAPAFAQGVVFAAQARRRAGNQVPHLEQACQTVLGLDTLAAADIAVASLPQDGHTLADYQHWRLAIQRHCVSIAPHLDHAENGGL